MLWKSLQSPLLWEPTTITNSCIAIAKANKNIYFFFGWGSFGLTKKGNLVSIYTIMVKSYKAKGSPL
jgi:hypothetical protein